MYKIVDRIGVDRIETFAIPAVGLAFLVGLLVGWLAIGWWLWPVNWTDADPWDLRAEHQEKYVILVARDFAQARNADQAREALSGWDDETLARLLGSMQDQTSSPETARQLAELASVLRLPPSAVAALPESEASSAVPSLRGRLPTICGTAAAVVAAAVLVIFAASTRPWESFATRERRIEPMTTEAEPALISNHFVSIYTQDQDDYADYFPIKAPNGQFLGECGLKSISRISGQGMSRRVTALEMVLLDSLDHCTETRILMTPYAFEEAALRRELTTRGELVLAEPGAEILVETNNLRMVAMIADLEYMDEEPQNGVFRQVVVDLNVTTKHHPTEASVEDESTAE